MTDDQVAQLRTILSGIAAGVEDMRKRVAQLEADWDHMRMVTDCLEGRVSKVEMSLPRTGNGFIDYLCKDQTIEVR